MGEQTQVLRGEGERAPPLILKSSTRDPTPFVDREHGRISFVEEDPIGEMFD